MGASRVCHGHDNFFSQWVPADHEAKPPRAVDIVMSALAQLHWSMWLLILVAIMALSLLEVAIRQARHIRALSLDERLPTSGRWTSRGRAPIRWTDYSHFLVVSSYVPPAALRDEWRNDPDIASRPVLRIERFQLPGTVTRPILLVSAQLQVIGGTGECIHMTIDGLPIAATGMHISAGANFTLLADFPATKSAVAATGVPIGRFYERYPNWLIRVETDAGVFTQEFTHADVREFLLDRLAGEWGTPARRPVAIPAPRGLI